MLLRVFLLVFAAFCAGSPVMAAESAPTFAGAKTCIECHPKEYTLWSTSHHALAMQSFTPEFAAKKLRPQNKAISVGKAQYRYDETGRISEWQRGERLARYPIKYVLGGKYVYYFITELERGILQTLPLGFDTRQHEWFNIPLTGIRHAQDSPVSWKDPIWRFNASCSRCHASHVTTQFSLKEKAYATHWVAQGVSCESCHGPASKHNAVCRISGHPRTDVQIKGGNTQSSPQRQTEACASCHAKSMALTPRYIPGDAFYDHFDLVCMENPDFYPDGQDLGENYTYTTWSLSPCVQSGKLQCLHCHTSSGRFRQKDNPNQACAPCHENYVQAPEQHTHHPAAKNSPQCISCHMLKTQFARMDRSDHSMRAPAPQLTTLCGSPNACTSCHTKQTPQWASHQLERWGKNTRIQKRLHLAHVLIYARTQNWDHFDEMLSYLSAPDSDPVALTSLIRILSRTCPYPQKWKHLLALTKHSSPLVRAAAVHALELHPAPKDILPELLHAAKDPTRLVRIRAASALTGIAGLSPKQIQQLHTANTELQTMLCLRPDTWSSHFNQGNHALKKGNIPEALEAYSAALWLAPTAIPPSLHKAYLLAQTGKTHEAKKLLSRALSLGANKPELYFALGDISLMENNWHAAQGHFLRTLQIAPQFWPATLKLAQMNITNSVPQALAYAQDAYTHAPTLSATLTLAQCLSASQKKSEAFELLYASTQHWPTQTTLYLNMLPNVQTQQEYTRLQKKIAHALPLMSSAEQKRVQKALASPHGSPTKSF